MPAPCAKPIDDVTIDSLLCFAIYSAGHALNRVYKPLLDPLGLTYPKYLAMVALWERDGVTVGELGERLSLESNTLTPLLKRLETDGLVRRARDRADERQVRIGLTDKGRLLGEQARQIPTCILSASGMSLPNVRRLHGDILSLKAALDSYSAASSN